MGYWNSKRGVDGDIWRNISPSTAGRYDATLTNIDVDVDGMNFNGINSVIEIPLPTEMHQPISATMEFIFKTDPSKTTIGQVLVSDVNDYQSYIIPNGLFRNHVHSGVFDTVNHDRYGTGVGITSIDTYDSTFYVSYRLDADTNTINVVIYDYDLDRVITNEYPTTGVAGRVVEANTIRMGLDNSQSYPYKGIMDSIRLYNRRLTDEEIRKNISFIKQVGL